jgi:cyclohexadieny/prephenate dehydrogenase
MSAKPLYRRLGLIGVGLIGSSIARAARLHNLAGEIVATSRTAETRAKVVELKLADKVHADAARAVEGCDLVIICTPLSTYAAIGRAIAPHLAPGCTLTDVGSCKQSVVRDLEPLLPDHVHFIPAHPVAGTEHSGPEAGFAELFVNRWCILTPPPGVDAAALRRLSDFWTALGSRVEKMEPRHHDLVLAITSHVPHLIAYNIVGTAADLQTVTKSEVIKYSAGGFRDFTRIAASDPVMWRDVFLNNREAVLEMLGRFLEDLASLQRAIRWSDGDALYNLFTRTRAIRRAIIDAGQEVKAANFGRPPAGEAAPKPAPRKAKPEKAGAAAKPPRARRKASRPGRSRGR